MKESLKTLLFIFILSLLLSSLHAQQTTTVIRIVDGDTLKVRYWGKDESIRLIGIDTPESRVNKKAKRDAARSGQDLNTITSMGKRATEYVESLVKPGDLITIEFDAQQRDRYGRLLGYVYLSNGKMLNEEIVMEKRVINQRYIDEIDGFRGWESADMLGKLASIEDTHKQKLLEIYKKLDTFC